MTSRENHLVQIVYPDSDGKPTGATTTVAMAHLKPGKLHSAFSLLLWDRNHQRVLLARRSTEKNRFPGLWANTCCGHPTPEDFSPTAAAVSRARDELGLELDEGTLVEAGAFYYEAHDVANRRVEREYDRVITGVIPANVELVLDPSEVAEVRWLDPADVEAELRVAPATFAPWFPEVFRIALAARSR